MSIFEARSSQLSSSSLAGIAFEEGLARHAVALGQPQHLAAQRHQAAVVAVELVDQIFDLGLVELDALHFRGELFR